MIRLIRLIRPAARLPQTRLRRCLLVAVAVGLIAACGSGGGDDAALQASADKPSDDARNEQPQHTPSAVPTPKMPPYRGPLRDLGQ